MLSDNSHTYKYDAEGRLISVDNGSTASYVYNAEGERVEKDAGGSYTEYVFGLTQKPEGEYNRTTGTGTWADTWVSFQGRHFAHFSNGDTYFVHADRIGTTNIVTDWNTGTVIQDELHYPWGQVWTTVGSSIEERFASLQYRDSESNLDPTKYRMFSSDAGRWTSPDPAQADISDPQSMSSYAYAGNNPVGTVDPFGLYFVQSGNCMYNEIDY